MIDVIVRHGGDVLKFAGDAMLVMFPAAPVRARVPPRRCGRKSANTRARHARRSAHVAARLFRVHPPCRRLCVPAR
eukprot:5182424-Prymnesium_polylepis.2